MLTTPAHVHWATCADGATAVLDLHTCQWRMLDGPAAQVWAALLHHHGDLKAAADELAPALDYDVAATHAMLNTYVTHLRAVGLLVETETTARSRWWRRTR